MGALLQILARARRESKATPVSPGVDRLDRAIALTATGAWVGPLPAPMGRRVARRLRAMGAGASTRAAGKDQLDVRAQDPKAVRPLAQFQRQRLVVQAGERVTEIDAAIDARNAPRILHAVSEARLHLSVHKGALPKASRQALEGAMRRGVREWQQVVTAEGKAIDRLTSPAFEIDAVRYRIRGGERNSGKRERGQKGTRLWELQRQMRKSGWLTEASVSLPNDQGWRKAAERFGIGPGRRA